MIFYVPNSNGINRFIEQISVTTDTQSSLTKNVDVAGSQGATKRINYRFNQQKDSENCGNTQQQKISVKKIICTFVLTLTHFVWVMVTVFWTSNRSIESRISVNICHVVMISGSNRWPYISLLACRIILTGKLVSSLIILFYSCVSVGNKQSVSVFSATTNSRWL